MKWMFERHHDCSIARAGAAAKKKCNDYPLQDQLTNRQVSNTRIYYSLLSGRWFSDFFPHSANIRFVNASIFASDTQSRRRQ